MTKKNAAPFAKATERLKRERGLAYRTQAQLMGISAQYHSDCRVGRKVPSPLVWTALRAIAASAPRLPEEPAAHDA